MKRFLFLVLIILLVLPVSAVTTAFTMPDVNDGTFQNSTTAACEGRLWSNYATVQPLGSGGYTGPRLTATTNAGECNANRRFFWSVPTDGIPDGDTIDSAKLCFVGRYTSSVPSKSNGLGEPTFTIIGFTPAGFPIVASDSATNGTTEYITALAYADMPGNNLSICTDFNAAGIAAISKTGNTSFLGVLRDWDLFGNSVGYTWASSGNSNFYLWDSYYGEPWGSNLTVTYHNVTFTKNQSTPTTPNKAVQFNDTSSSLPTTWGWNFTDYRNATVKATQFSTVRNATQLFGAGNFSITLTTDIGTSPAQWLNISAGVYRQGLESPSITGFVEHPADHIYNTNIASLPVHPNSSVWLVGMTNGTSSPADTYLLITAVAPNASVVDANISLSAPINKWGPAGGSNGTVFPISDYIYSSNPGETQDHWMKMLDIDNNWKYGIYDGYSAKEQNYNLRFPNGTYHSYSTYAINLSDYTIPDGIRADPPTIRYDEAEAGDITHMVCFASYNVSTALPSVWPIKYNNGNNNTVYAPPNGAVLRLKQNFFVGNYTPHQQHILNGLKNYGAVICDNTGNTQPPNWFGGQVVEENDNWLESEFGHWQQWHGYQNTANATVDNDHVHAEDFEFVDVSSLMISEDSGHVAEPPETPTVLLLIINYISQFFHIGAWLT